MTFSARSRLALARAALEHRPSVRLAMRGTSMLPLFHEPMVAEVTPLQGRARRGDVLVFELQESYSAHRVVGYAQDDYLTSGDAQPQVVERVRVAQVLGRLVALWSNDTATARRVDTRAFRLRGWWYAHLHAVRACRPLPSRLVRRIGRLLHTRPTGEQV